MFIFLIYLEQKQCLYDFLAEKNIMLYYFTHQKKKIIFKIFVPPKLNSYFNFIDDITPLSSYPSNYINVRERTRARAHIYIYIYVKKKKKIVS